MSKYTIVRRCGHTEDVQIYGPVAGRDRQAEYESGKLCYECYKAEQAANLAAESAAVAEAAKASGLPSLTGSPKQIAWAETIRKVAADCIADFRARIASTMERARAEGRDLPPTYEPARAAAEAIFTDLLAQTDARYWIDNRHALGDKTAFAQWVDRAISARLRSES